MKELRSASGEGTDSGAVWWAAKRVLQLTKELDHLRSEHGRLRDLVEGYSDMVRSEVAASDASAAALDALLKFKPGIYRRPI